MGGAARCKLEAVVLGSGGPAGQRGSMRAAERRSNAPWRVTAWRGAPCHTTCRPGMPCTVRPDAGYEPAALRAWFTICALCCAWPRAGLRSPWPSCLTAAPCALRPRVGLAPPGTDTNARAARSCTRRSTRSARCWRCTSRLPMPTTDLPSPL